MVPHTFLDGIWYSIGHPLHAKLTCQAQKVVQFFFPHLCLPEVDEVHHSCVSESPHEDDRVRLVNLEQQVFEERTRGSEDHPVGIEPLSIFTDQSDIREVNGVAQIFERRSQVCLELVRCSNKCQPVRTALKEKKTSQDLANWRWKLQNHHF